MSILLHKPHDVICLATAQTAHSPCSQNVLNFAHNYKTIISHFPHDKLGKKFSSYIWVLHNIETDSPCLSTDYAKDVEFYYVVSTSV
jgi:hypothetical protein